MKCYSFVAIKQATIISAKMIRASLLLVCAIATMVSSVTLTPEMREQMFNIQTECMTKTGATDEMVMNAFAGRFSDAPELAEHFICCAKHNGIIDEDNHLHKDVFKQKLLMVIDNEAKIDQTLDKCMVETGTIQETAISSAKCMFNEFSNM